MIRGRCPSRINQADAEVVDPCVELSVGNELHSISLAVSVRRVHGFPVTV